MRMKQLARGGLLLAMLGLLYLPLSAGEAPTEPPPEPEEQAASPAEGAEAQPPASEPAPTDAAAEEDPEDRLSADNNLSYPVDI